ncbi:cyclin-dependent kinase inhibitor 3 isoform X1 [Solanum pennellii]|uniref:Cyclin-dependent kinase inhibitor n=1 Tax=Solanum pennellii TaxID=28526 RepID=A0ABM1VHN6_SOLPN|nr:cyclin-dependent kinase inhibitor 3 isoform X1 [Solanum pennellii]
MGKYLRKSGHVMESSSLGVRTRSTTLALQRLQSSSSSTPPPSLSSASDSCYLQLRSRRLHKPPTPIPYPNSHPHSASVGSVDEISFPDNNLHFQHTHRETPFEHFWCWCCIRGSTRESTPCSLVREVDEMVNPGSATRGTELNTTTQRTRNFILRNIPSAHEIEEFFTFAEQQQQRLFMEKYNFDVVNDVPLSGRYEWIRVKH